MATLKLCCFTWNGLCKDCGIFDMLFLFWWRFTQLLGQCLKRFQKSNVINRKNLIRAFKMFWFLPLCFYSPTRRDESAWIQATIVKMFNSQKTRRIPKDVFVLSAPIKANGIEMWWKLCVGITIFLISYPSIEYNDQSNLDPRKKRLLLWSVYIMAIRANTRSSWDIIKSLFSRRVLTKSIWIFHHETYQFNDAHASMETILSTQQTKACGQWNWMKDIILIKCNHFEVNIFNHRDDPIFISRRQRLKRNWFN